MIAPLLLWASLHPIVADARGGEPVDSHYQRTCTSGGCHSMPHDEPGLIRHPSYLERWCDNCHTDHSSQTEMLLIAQPEELCLSCHAESETAHDSIIHPPGSGNCTDCHSPHQSSVRHLLRDEELLLSCSECHEEDLREAAEKPFKHRFFDPRAECGSCHYAHRAGEDGAYLRGNLGETCLTCHDMDIRSRGRALENVGLQIRNARHVHEPLHEDLCHACHTPHGAMQPSLLRENYPAGSYTRYERRNYSLCWTCHDSAMVEMPETRDATGFRNGSVNLHNIHVMQSGRGRACHLCHTAHASDRPHLLRERITFGSWESDFEFDPLPDGGSCLTACHREEAYRRSIP